MVYAVLPELFGAHLREHDVVCLPTEGAPHLACAGIGTTYDPTGLPENDVVEKFPPGESYLAHDLLIEVMGAQAFFACSPFSSSSGMFSLASSSPMYHDALMV